MPVWVLQRSFCKEKLRQSSRGTTHGFTKEERDCGVWLAAREKVTWNPSLLLFILFVPFCSTYVNVPNCPEESTNSKSTENYNLHGPFRVPHG